MVEYILLLAVVVSLVLTFFRSDLFRSYFGNEGSLGVAMKRGNEFAYRHAYGTGRSDVPRNIRDGSQHPSYYDPQNNETRFFSGIDPYPQ